MNSRLIRATLNDAFTARSKHRNSSYAREKEQEQLIEQAGARLHSMMPFFDAANTEAFEALCQLSLEHHRARMASQLTQRSRACQPKRYRCSTVATFEGYA